MIAQIKPGQAYTQITLERGEKALLRGPTWNDLDDLTEYINALVHERAEITKAEPVKREEEAEWLGQRLSDIENGSMIMLVAEVDEKVVAVGEVSVHEGERSHTGYLVVGVAKNKRGLGLGMAMMLALLELSKRAELKIVILDVFATNTAAIKLYEKLGFKEAGRITKGVLRDGKYIDLVRMTIEL